MTKSPPRGFAECRIREALGKDLFFKKKILCRVPPDLALGKDLIFILKNLCRVSQIWHSAKKFFLKKNTLPSAPGTALGKDLIFFYNFFAECSCGCTRQRGFLKKKLKHSLPSALFLALGKDPFAECHTPALGKVFFVFLFLASNFFV